MYKKLLKIFLFLFVLTQNLNAMYLDSYDYNYDSEPLEFSDHEPLECYDSEQPEFSDSEQLQISDEEINNKKYSNNSSKKYNVIMFNLKKILLIQSSKLEEKYNFKNCKKIIKILNQARNNDIKIFNLLESFEQTELVNYLEKTIWSNLLTTNKWVKLNLQTLLDLCIWHEITFENRGICFTALIKQKKSYIEKQELIDIFIKKLKMDINYKDPINNNNTVLDYVLTIALGEQLRKKNTIINIDNVKKYPPISHIKLFMNNGARIMDNEKFREKLNEMLKHENTVIKKAGEEIFNFFQAIKNTQKKNKK